MGRTAKVSISLPEELLRDVERSRGENETRSDFFRRAAETQLRHDRERELVDRYVQGYIDHPETADEQAWGQLGSAQLAEVEW